MGQRRPRCRLPLVVVAAERAPVAVEARQPRLAAHAGREKAQTLPQVVAEQEPLVVVAPLELLRKQRLAHKAVPLAVVVRRLRPDKQDKADAVPQPALAADAERHPQSAIANLAKAFSSSRAVTAALPLNLKITSFSSKPIRT